MGHIVPHSLTTHKHHTRTMNTAEKMGYNTCEETGCVMLYLSVEQLKNITCMVQEVATTEENATKRDGEFILSELYECLEGASWGKYSPYDLK